MSNGVAKFVFYICLSIDDILSSSANIFENNEGFWSHNLI